MSTILMFLFYALCTSIWILIPFLPPLSWHLGLIVFFLLLHRRCQCAYKRCHLRIRKHLLQKNRINILRHSHLWRCRLLRVYPIYIRVQVLSLVERLLKQLGILPAVFVDNVAVNIRHHIYLGMPGITLYRLDISAVQFQLMKKQRSSNLIHTVNQ